MWETSAPPSLPGCSPAPPAGGFLLRVEDLDRARAGAEAEQLRDLAAIGVTWDGAVVRQTDRGPLYAEAIWRLAARA